MTAPLEQRFDWNAPMCIFAREALGSCAEVSEVPSLAAFAIKTDNEIDRVARLRADAVHSRFPQSHCEICCRQDRFIRIGRTR